MAASNSEERRGLLTASDEEMDAALEKLLAGGYEDGAQGPGQADSTGQPSVDGTQGESGDTSPGREPDEGAAGDDDQDDPDTTPDKD